MLSVNQFYWLPDRLSGNRYGMVTYEVVANQSISRNARLLYCIISTYVNRESGESWPSISTLADGMECSQRTVSRAIKELVKYQVIARCKGGHLSRSTILLK
jgi:DeoR/GlpR family transcriptional regulator of sugar metabolism